nr:JAB domain-containing protein [Flavobacterium sp. 1355]
MRTLRRAGELLDIKLLNHLIITSETYYSFADEGAL